MKFITLHTVNNNRLFINVEHITAVTKSFKNEDLTYLYVIGSDEQFAVLETVNEIIAMLGSENENRKEK